MIIIHPSPCPCIDVYSVGFVGAQKEPRFWNTSQQLNATQLFWGTKTSFVACFHFLRDAASCHSKAAMKRRHSVDEDEKAVLWHKSVRLLIIPTCPAASLTEPHRKLHMSVIDVIEIYAVTNSLWGKGRALNQIICHRRQLEKVCFW